MWETAGVGAGALVAIAAAMGLIVGSFLNVVIHRLPRGESVVHPRSRCPHCGRPIRPLENVPIVSYLALRGRCRGCRATISLRYPALETVTGSLFAAVALRHGAAAETAVLCLFASLLLAAAMIDFEHQIIPDEISLGGLAAGLVLVPGAAWLGGADGIGAVVRSSAGAALGFALLWIVGFAHARVCAVAGRTFPHWPAEGEGYPRPGSLDYWTWFPGLGFGDVKLMAMIGAFVGPAGVVATIVLGSAAGLVLGLAWVLVRREWNAPFGFGPALAVGALLVVLWPLPLP